MKNNYDVVVFGGSSGIGLAAAVGFKKHGLSVLAVSRNSENNNELKAHEISTKNLDIFSDVDTKKFFTQVQMKHIVLSVALPLQFESVSNLDITNAKNSFEKTWAYLAIIKEAINNKTGLESITMISGAIAKNNVPGTISLKLMASSINEMAKTLAVELAPIRVNVVSPGVTDTPLYDVFANKDAMLKDMANDLPLKRLAVPSEIADAILFTTLNHNLTGAIIDIDGGASL